MRKRRVEKKTFNFFYKINLQLFEFHSRTMVLDSPSGHPGTDMKRHFYSIFTRIKGQLISKCPFGVKTSSKKSTELFLDFCPEILCTFLGASWKLFQLPGDLVSNIMNKEAYVKEASKSFRKPPGRYIKFQGRNPEIISFVFWKKF